MSPELRRLVEDLRSLEPALGERRRTRIVHAMRRRAAALVVLRAVAGAALVALAALLVLAPSPTAPAAAAQVASPPTCAPADETERRALHAARVASVSEPVALLEPSMRATLRTRRDSKQNGPAPARVETLHDPRQGALHPL